MRLLAIWTLAAALLRVAPGQSLEELVKEQFPSSSDCECVPYYQCGDNGTIIDNGVGLIDIRIKDEKCSDSLQVCCKAPQSENITPPPVTRRSCGERHPDGVGFRIIGDEDNEAQFGEFPWMVAVLKDEANKSNIYQCGGALIHPQAVLTAAHCVAAKKGSQLKIRAGEWDTQTTNELFEHQDRKVGLAIVHQEYYAGALYNDIAVLILEEPVEIIDNVDVVCLPEEGVELDHSRCFASGWGRDVFGKEGHYQVILKRVELPIVPHRECQSELRKTRLGSHFKLHKSFICAGGEPGKDTCKGDGGSPLVCPYADDPSRYMQAGIVAWGIGCGDQTPGVYANVPMFRKWIDDILAFHHLNMSEYQKS